MVKVHHFATSVLISNYPAQTRKSLPTREIAKGPTLSAPASESVHILGELHVGKAREFTPRFYCRSTPAANKMQAGW